MSESEQGPAVSNDQRSETEKGLDIRTEPQTEDAAIARRIAKALEGIAEELSARQTLEPHIQRIARTLEDMAEQLPSIRRRRRAQPDDAAKEARERLESARRRADPAERPEPTGDEYVQPDEVRLRPGGGR